MDLDKLSMEQFKGLNHVVVTLSPQGTKDTQLVGLFGGVMPISKTDTALVSQEDMYVCVIKGSVIHFLSSIFYHLIQIDIGGLKENGPNAPPVSLMTTFGEKEQAGALSVMKKIHMAMREEKKVTEYDIIDDEKYTGLSETQKRTINLEGPVSNTSKAINRSCGVNYGTEDYWTNQHKHNTNACGYGSAYKPKAITTATFARTKKAEQTELEDMAAKLKAIREGTYKPPDLPTIPADKVKEKKKEDEKKVIGTKDESSQNQSSPSEETERALEKYNFFMCG
jgi:hypothetical protein